MANRRVDNAELVRVGLRLSRDILNEFDTLSGELAMRRSHLLAMCATLGLRQVQRALHPETAFSPEVWQGLLKGLQTVTEADTEQFLKSKAK